MAERLQAELSQIKEKREMYSAAVSSCEDKVKESLKQFQNNVYNVIYPQFTAENKNVIDEENDKVQQLNKTVNNEVEGFQSRVNKIDSDLDTFLDNASSLDYFDKWSRNIKTKMYEVSHIMEEICQIEQDEMRVTMFSVSFKQTLFLTCILQ